MGLKYRNTRDSIRIPRHRALSYFNSEEELKDFSGPMINIALHILENPRQGSPYLSKITMAEWRKDKIRFAVRYIKQKEKRRVSNYFYEPRSRSPVTPKRIPFE